MTSGILQADVPASTQEADPQFDHAIRPWLLIGVAITMALILVALFMYGQIAPGA